MKELIENDYLGIYVPKITLKNNYFLIRHGQTDNNLKNIYTGQNNKIKLNNKGIISTINLANNVPKDLFFDHIFCSPMNRTKQVYQILKDKINFSTNSYEPKITAKNYGEIEGYKKNQIIGSPYDYGESFKDLRLRVLPFINELESKHENKSFAIITHSGILRIIRGYFENLDFEQTSKLVNPNSYIFSYLKNN